MAQIRICDAWVYSTNYFTYLTTDPYLSLVMAQIRICDAWVTIIDFERFRDVICM